MLKRTFTAAISALVLGASSVVGAGSAKADGNDIIGPIIIGAAIGGLIIAATHDDGHHAHRAPKRRDHGHNGHYKRKSNKHGHYNRGHRGSRNHAYHGHTVRLDYVNPRSNHRSGYSNNDRRRARAEDQLDRRRARAQDELDRRRERAQDELDRRRARAQNELDRRRARAQTDRRYNRVDNRRNTVAERPRRQRGDGYTAWRN